MVLMFVIIILSIITEHILTKDLAEDIGWKKPRVKVKLKPLIYTQIRWGRNKSKEVKGKIAEKYATQGTWKWEEGKAKKKIQSKLREEQMRSQDKPVLRAPKTAISP